MYEYFSPEVRIEIGNYIVEKHIILELHLDDEKTFDWAIITFTVDLLRLLSMNKGDRVRIFLGYEGILDEILVGDVIGIKRDKLYIRNDFVKLAKTFVVKSFVKCTPQEVVAFILGQAGVDYKLSSEAYPMRDLLSIGNQTALEALKYVDQKWGIRNSIYLFRGATFEWNMPHEQQVIYTFEYTKNILDLQNICPKVWELTTISVPKIKVLDYINVQHFKIKGTFKVHLITFSVNDWGFVRTKLTFREA